MKPEQALGTSDTALESWKHLLCDLKIWPTFSQQKWCWLNLNMGQNEQNEQKLLKMDLKMSKNTVLGYKKGLQSQNIFSNFEKIYFQLSNTLLIVFILCLHTKIHNISKLYVLPFLLPFHKIVIFKLFTLNGT